MMRPLSARELLSVWEQGLVQTSIQRGLSLLAVASPDLLPDALARLTVGQRDGRLLTLRAWTFGEQIAGLSTCPACGERLEFTFRTGDVLLPMAEEMPASFDLDVDGYHLCFRLPDSQDITAVSQNGSDATTARQQLLQRCLLAANYQGEAQTVEALPPAIIATLTDQMAKADPQADMQTAFCCPACGNEWQAVFDIISFFWTEIDAWAMRTFRQVHELASAYHWPEADILAMSAWRRQMYLSVVNH